MPSGLVTKDSLEAVYTIAGKTDDPLGVRVKEALDVIEQTIDQHGCVSSNLWRVLFTVGLNKMQMSG
jgi:hypothetical protein